MTLYVKKNKHGIKKKPHTHTKTHRTISSEGHQIQDYTKINCVFKDQQ